MADFEQLQDAVLQKLPLLNVGQLEECCVQLAIDIPADKKGKKTATRSLVLNYVSTEAFEEQNDATEVLQKMIEDFSKSFLEPFVFWTKTLNPKSVNLLTLFD